MKLPSYREANPYNSGTAYNFTNEEPELFARMLGNRTFKKAASICSGGEVAFGVILPRSEEVFAVDHAAGSIAVAMLKAALLQIVGIRELRKLLATGTYADLQPHIKEAFDTLPVDLQKFVKLNKPGPNDPLYYSAPVFQHDFTNFRREWTYLPAKALFEAVEKLDKVTCVHGDIRDLKDNGPFDLLYTSNASEHTGRAGMGQTSLASFAELLEPGGILMCALGSGSHGTTTPIHKLKLVEKIVGYRTSWVHMLFEKEAN